MEPAYGVLQPREELPVAVTVMSQVPGPLDIVIGCEVEAASRPLVCGLTGEVRGLQVAYSLAPQPSVAELLYEAQKPAMEAVAFVSDAAPIEAVGESRAAQLSAPTDDVQPAAPVKVRAPHVVCSLV